MTSNIYQIFDKSHFWNQFWNIKSILRNSSLIAVFLTLLIENPGNAQDEVILPRPRDGKLTEYCPSAEELDVLTISCDVEIFPTDNMKKDITNVLLFPQKGFLLGGTSKTFNIPSVIQIKGTEQSPMFRDIFDVRQILKLNITQRTFPLQQNINNIQGEPISDLSFEAVFFDESTNQFVLGNIFGALSERLGSNFPEVLVPDLFGDINGDGVIGNGDTLYSIVDLNIYTQGEIPSFNFGDSFNIVNGQVNSLPGMMFSTAPFIFEPENGIVNTAPFTGPGITLGTHGLASVPEPSFTLGFLALGTLGAASTLKRKLKPSKPSEKETTKVG